ncbi:hypothetical protein ACTXYW_16475 [Pseudomonas aeruginosa]
MPGFEVVLAGAQACFCSCSRDLSSSRQARWIITSVIGIFPALGVDDGATAVLLRIEGDHAALGGIGVLRIHCPSPHQVYRQSRERR